MSDSEALSRAEIEEITILLIRQDLKHNQLSNNLRSIGLEDNGLYDLDLMAAVARMMGIPRGSTSDEWVNTYMEFMNQSAECEVTESGKGLTPLAEKCYARLKAAQSPAPRESDQNNEERES